MLKSELKINLAELVLRIGGPSVADFFIIILQNRWPSPSYIWSV
jgi:hypothetical protein